MGTVRLIAAAAGLVAGLGACSDGGTSPDPDPSDTLPATSLAGSWATAAPLPLTRWASGVAEFQGLICVAGGLEGSTGGRGSQEVFRDDPGTDSWERIADLPAARSDMPLAVVGDTLYAVAGLFEPGNAPLFPVNSLWLYDIANGDALDSVLVYDLSTDSWSRTVPLPLPRSESAVHVIGGSLYAVGGVAGDGSLAVGWTS